MIGAIGSATFASHVHREVVTVDAVVRQYAEQLTAGTYQPGATAYPEMVDPPAGFRARTLNVDCWNGATATPMVFVDGCSPDSGVQLVTVEASRANGARAQQLQIVLRQR
jgi:hypothetical protein